MSRENIVVTRDIKVLHLLYFALDRTNMFSAAIFTLICVVQYSMKKTGSFL